MDTILYRRSLERKIIINKKGSRKLGGDGHVYGIDCFDGFKGVSKNKKRNKIKHKAMRFSAAIFKAQCSGMLIIKIQLTKKYQFVSLSL